MSYESPAEHPTITDEERCYIEESIGESAKLMGPAEVREYPPDNNLHLRQTIHIIHSPVVLVLLCCVLFRVANLCVLLNLFS